MPEPVLEATVDIVLYLVLDGAPPASLLVLRRSVVASAAGAAGDLRDGDRDEGVVEHLWAGEPLGSRPAVLHAVRALRPVAGPLVLGRSPGAIPGMHDTAGTRVPDVGDDGWAGTVEVLVAYRGVVHDLAGAPVLRGSDLVVPSRTAAARAARDVFAAALSAHGLRETDGSGPGGSPDPVVSRDDDRDALAEDLADARARVAGFLWWTRLADLPLEPAPGSPDRAGPSGQDPADVVWTGWIRRDGVAEVTPGDADRDPPDRVVVTFVRVDGVQAGRGNTQTNLFTYRLDPRIDLSAALRDPAVRDAFAACSRAPDDDGLRQRAVDALRCTCAGAPSDWREDTRFRGPGQARVDAAVEAFGGTVVFAGCRGVQVGDRMRQVNTFTCTLSPDVRAAELLHGNPELVRAVVDHVCREDGPGDRDVRRLLCDAVTDRGSDVYARGPGVVSPRAGRVVDEVGQTFGPGARQYDAVEVIPRLDKEIARVLQRERAATPGAGPPDRTPAPHPRRPPPPGASEDGPSPGEWPPRRRRPQGIRPPEPPERDRPPRTGPPDADHDDEPPVAEGDRSINEIENENEVRPSRRQDRGYSR